MRCLSCLLIVALSVLSGSALGQSPSEIAELKQQLQRVLEKQGRLEAENQQLRSQMHQLSEAQDTLRAENVALHDEVVEGGALEEHVNTLVSRLNATGVDSKAEKVSLTGELRFRTVWATVQPAGGGEFDGYWTDARARLGFGYQFSDHVTAQVDLQSHWAYGGGAPTAGGTPFGPFSFGEASTAVNLYQANLMVDQIFGRDELSMKIGRQEVVLGNQFQFGNAEWYSGWVFDGFRFDWKGDGYQLTALAMKLGTADLDVNQLHSALGTHDDDELYGLYATFEVAEKHTIDAYWIYINGHGGSGSGTTTGSLGNSVGGAGLAGGSTAYYHTLGARIAGTFDVVDGLDYNVEAAFQIGDVNGGGGIDDVAGFSVEAEVGLTFDKESAFRVFVRFLYADGPSGNDSGYIPLYPNRHANSGFLARYGLLDALPMVDVLSPQAGFYFKPGDAWLAGATFIWSIADERVAAGNDDWGWEGDLWAAYAYSDNLTFIFAGFVVSPGDQLQALVGIDDDTIFGLVFQARLSF